MREVPDQSEACPANESCRVRTEGYDAARGQDPPRHPPQHRIQRLQVLPIRTQRLTKRPNPGLVSPTLWIGMMIALAAAFAAAFPVNRHLIDNGKGHALTHHHIHDATDSNAALHSPGCSAGRRVGGRVGVEVFR